MDYFDLAAPLLCARIVDVVDAINNKGVSFKNLQLQSMSRSVRLGFGPVVARLLTSKTKLNIF